MKVFNINQGFKGAPKMLDITFKNQNKHDTSDCCGNRDIIPVRGKISVSSMVQCMIVEIPRLTSYPSFHSSDNAYWTDPFVRLLDGERQTAKDASS